MPEINIGALTDVINDKLDCDLENISITGKTTCAKLSMASSTVINLTLGANGATYTAPADGYVQFRAHSTAASGSVQIYRDYLFSHTNAKATNSELSACVNIKSGDTFQVYYTDVNTSDSWYKFVFIYAEGAKP